MTRRLGPRRSTPSLFMALIGAVWFRATRPLPEAKPTKLRHTRLFSVWPNLALGLNRPFDLRPLSALMRCSVSSEGASLQGGVPPSGGRPETVALSGIPGLLASPRRRALSRGRPKNRCRRRQSFDRFMVLLALLCNMDGKEKRHQALDLTALTGLRGQDLNLRR